MRHLSQIDGDLRRGRACCGGPRPRLACGGVPRRGRACGGRGLQRGNRLCGTAEGASKSSCFFSSDMIAGAKKLRPQLYSASEYCENYCDKRSIGLVPLHPLHGTARARGRSGGRRALARPLLERSLPGRRVLACSRADACAPPLLERAGPSARWTQRRPRPMQGPLQEVEDDADEWGPPGSERSSGTQLSER